MATLILSAAGAAIGSGFGGTIVGLSGAIIGRALGATLGRVIDQRILGAGSDPVEVGRIDRFRLTGASEGTPIARLWGRMRIGGHLIWSTQFTENVRRGGGGKASQPSTQEFSYSISFALGLCEGKILRVGRVWADGEEIEPGSLAMRVYTGGEDQLPDPRIEAVEGAGQAPAYRGLAYVVIEDLDLTPYGNRVPQMTFEVVRPAQGPSELVERPLSDLIRGVAMIPGSGEYALATTPVLFTDGPGRSAAVNVNSPSGLTDFSTSLEQLMGEAPACASVSLVVSWFGSDLRAGFCSIKPKVDQSAVDASNMPWRAGGIVRSAAETVPQVGGVPIYGGTPTDQSVIQAIRAIRDAGREVMFYPFILMDQVPGNILPDPYSLTQGQPALPWRGRITTSVAPGQNGSPDGTAAAGGEVAQFFGTAIAADFAVTGETIDYAGPVEWGLRRFILHYAHLCAAAGGVDAFCIGSELRGLTQIRDSETTFPGVEALRVLAADVRAILGPACRISYAADWSEYGSYQAAGNLYFPLDPLWADTNIDFVGIDNYMPIADWRDGLDHADSAAGSTYNLDYLMANIAGGEGFDWFYDSPEGEAAQVRRPIEDGAYDEPWVYRPKDLKSWWELPHHARTGGLRNPVATPWVPGSKPIVFTEYGCAAIDKGANQPNRFLDALSSESALPRASTGRRDDLMQMQYLRAMSAYWGDPSNNPPSQAYSGSMVDMDRAHAWAWDARPFPQFPGRQDLWSDARSYFRGHWLNGRITNQSLSSVIGEISASAMGSASDAVVPENALAVVRGYVIDQTQSARASLQPLMQVHGIDAIERDGRLLFPSRRAAAGRPVNLLELAVGADADGREEFSRQAEVENPGIVRLAHVDAEGAYDVRAAEARHPETGSSGVSVTEVSVALTNEEARSVAERWMAEARIGQDGLRLDLPPSLLGIGAGDLLDLGGDGLYRIDRVEVAETRRIEAVRIETAVYMPSEVGEDAPPLRPFVAPVPVYPVFLDLPLMTGAEVPHAPHIAVAARPWPGSVSVWSSPSTDGFVLNRLVAAPSILGVTETDLAAGRPGVWDRGAPLRIKLSDGALLAADEDSVLNGANLMAIGDGSSENWELFQFAEAVLVAPLTWEVSLRLRGQAGTDGIQPSTWPSGSTVVLIDRAMVQIDYPPSARGLARNFRIGATARGLSDPLVVARTEAFDGIGLRPYPVAHLRSTGSPGSTVTAIWVRRTRVDGDTWAQTEVPLAEESEAYLVRVRQGAILRAEYQVQEPAFSYSAVAQTADGVSGMFQLDVAQVSSRFGPGPFRSVDVS
jgi:hypothetical protein